jgi:hypothetical protein
MPHYYFDIKDGHRFVDPSGLEFKNDDALRKQIFSVPVYSKPSMGTT